MWDEIPMSPASRCLDMSQVRCKGKMFDLCLIFSVRPDEAYVYASKWISDPHHILGHAAWGCPGPALGPAPGPDPGPDLYPGFEKDAAD